MARHWYFGVLCTAAFAGSIGFARAQTSGPLAPPAFAIYDRAIAAMSALPIPASVTYDATVQPQGLDLRVLQVRGLNVMHLAFSSARAPQVFHVEQRAGQETAALLDASGQRSVAELPFWSPLLPAASNAPIDADRSTVIDVVRDNLHNDLVTAAAGYTMTLVDEETVDGAPVYHLHLVADDAEAHPLTDLFVDERSFLVRRAAADFTDRSVATVTGTLTLNFTPVEGYWLVTSGRVNATVHAYFRKVSGAATFALSRFEALPQQTP